MKNRKIMEGFIALHRKITKNEFYFSERFTKMQAWVDLLILANHQPNTLYIRGIEVHIDRGQLCWAKISLAERWKWNRRTVNSFISTLQNRKMIHSNSTSLTTIITILNYDEYQFYAQQNDKKVHNRVHNKVHNRVHTDNNVDNVNNEEKLYRSDQLKKIDLESLKKTFKNIDVDYEFERFTDWLKSKDKRYKNYNSTFKNWLRSDWAKKKSDVTDKKIWKYCPSGHEKHKVNNDVNMVCRTCFKPLVSEYEVTIAKIQKA
jgi:hypothetical protein